MKKKLTLFLLSTIISFPLFATHIAGGDLTYECLGGNDYVFTFKLYRDCSGIAANSSITFNFKSPQSSFTSSAPFLGSQVREITQVCPGQVTSCNSGSVYGIQEYIYQTNVTLIPDANWVISVSISARNTIPAITSSGNFYIEARLNNLAAPCNNSPQFSNPPNAIMCVGQTFCFNNGASDPDGDSLSYEMTTPMVTANTVVTYQPGYTFLQPIPSNPPVSIDPSTGNICMTPTANTLSITALVVREWRRINGTLINVGTVMRDIQLKSIACVNSIPTLSGIDTINTQYDPSVQDFSITECYGTTINFNIFGYDPDAGDNISISWNKGISGASLVMNGNGTPNPYASFTWNPKITDLNRTRCFTATVKDNACPYIGTQTFGYCITVKGITVDLGPTDTLLCQGEVLVTDAISDPPAVNHYWSLNGTPISLPPSTSQYTINTASMAAGTYLLGIVADDGGITTQCPAKDSIRVRIVPQPNIDLGPDQKPCEGELITLDAGAGVAFLWNTGATSSSITVNTDGIYMVTVDGGNGTRCIDSDTVLVNFFPTPSDVSLGIDTCVPEPFVLDAGNSGFLYDWSTGDTTQTIEVAQSGTYSVTVTADRGSSCLKTDDIFIEYKPDPVVELGSDTFMCSHHTLSLSAQQPGSGYTYLWLPSNANTPSITIEKPAVGMLTINAEVTGCLNPVSDSRAIEVKECPLEIPNVFTPNGDGKNDFFKIVNLEFYPNSSLVVYNRWGKKVFESSNYQGNWDGGDNSDGVYFYVLKVNYGTEQVEQLDGTVTVIGKQ